MSIEFVQIMMGTMFVVVWAMIGRIVVADR